MNNQSINQSTSQSNISQSQVTTSSQACLAIKRPTKHVNKSTQNRAKICALAEV